MKTVTSKSDVALKMHRSSTGVLAPGFALACINWCRLLPLLALFTAIIRNGTLNFKLFPR